MKFLRFSSRELSIVVLGLLVASFMGLGVKLQPAHALAPTVSNTCASTAQNLATLNCSLTVAAVGDVVGVMAEIADIGTGGLYTITGVTSAGVSGGFTEYVSVNAKCISSVAFCNGAGNPNEFMFTSFWYGAATSSGAITVTVTGSSSATSVLGQQDFDVQNSGTSPTFFSTGGCDAVKNQDCGNPITTGTPANPIVASVYLVGALTIGSAMSSAGTGFVFVSAANPDSPAGEYAQNTLVPPTNFPINLNGGSGLNTGFAMIGVTFSLSNTTTVTTVINTACLGACSGGNNGTAQYLGTTFSLHFYASQNLAAAAQIDNVTVKVSNVKINTPTGIFYVCVYGATGVPNGGNPYSLIQACSAHLITNGTSNFFIHANPQVNLASQQYYAVAVMAGTTKCNCAGVTGSGVSLYETSQSGIIEYKYNVGSSSPPSSFFSSSTQTPRDFIFIHSVFSVATITTTTTLTLSGLVTSTTTTTVTSTNLINQLNMSAAGFWFIPMMFLLLPVGLLVAIKRIADGRDGR